MSRDILSTAAVALLLCSFSTLADSLSGRVIGVIDGDTVDVLAAGNERMRVRLGEIDAPEKRQAYGTRSKQALSDLCFDKVAVVETKGRDRYGRTIGRVRCAGVDANAEQVRQGLAWVYDRYVTDRGLYAVQDEARAGHRGLWADQAPVPPWEWRKQSHKQLTQSSPIP